MLVLTAMAITLRFWSRSLLTLHRLRFWWDDWVALAAVPFVIVEFELIFYMLSLGLCRHMNTLPAENIATSLLVIYIIYYVYDIGLFQVKESALLLLCRVFTRQTHRTWFNYGTWGVHALNVSWLLGIVFGTVFMCDPVAKNYMPALDGRCGDTGALWIGSAIPSVVIDLIILILPLPKIWGFQMSLAKKSGITIVFMLGYCVIIVSLGRLVTEIKSASALNEDLTYEGVPALYWLCAESPITLLSVCLPPMISLGRYLVINYFSPLSNKLSSLKNSRISGSRLRSQTGDMGSSRDFHLLGTRSDGSHGGSRAGESAYYADSNQQILHLAPIQDYEARIEGGGGGNSNGPDLSDQSIHIGKTVEVIRQDR
ncbi:hypothetical protein F4677DRAFT_407 [Hypoxylon crocopeplum]|nr:hypothetical protein F4677DRAFT_407 [Hypoxylon crocopeplum]